MFAIEVIFEAHIIYDDCSDIYAISKSPFVVIDVFTGIVSH